MAQFYANENFPLPVVEGLRRLGHDVLTVQETGRANQRFPDSDVLEFAVGEKRVVLTLNRRDFVRLHRESQDHHGIIVCTEDPDFDAQADRIHQAILAAGDLTGQLVRVVRPSR
ncbi:MAG: DUF5615 family PIN-like protein [Planctomycetes bacterium]|nr:DUF5615 family PIN-like protein [Planctomycetota bacterium]